MKNIKVRKILSIMILILTLFSCIQPVLAASGSGRWTGSQYSTGMYTSDGEILGRRLNDYNTGERKTVFCAQHGVGFTTGVVYDGIYYTPTDARMKKACQIAYLGWYKNNSWYTIDGGISASEMIWVKWDYVFTQQYIWESLGQSNAWFTNPTEQNGYIEFKNRINNEIAQIETRPSFNGSTITISAGETKTIEDTNGVLSSYKGIDVTRDGIRFQHDKDSNSMSITVDANTSLENYRISDNTFKDWGMIKEGTEDNDTMIYFEFNQGQDQMYCMNYNDPITLNMQLKIESFGKLELSKLDPNGNLLDGAVYNVKGPNEFNQDVAVTNGKITLEKLAKGTYTIREVNAPSGYLIDTKSYNVEVKVNETSYQAITNTEPTGNFTLIKKNADKSKNLEGARYRVWNDNGYDMIFITDAEGKIEATGLKLGKYNYQEIIAPNGYLVDTKVYSFELKYKDQNTDVIYENVERTDDEPTGNFTLIKKNANKTRHLQGAKYRIWNDNGYDKEFTTNLEGKIEVTGLKLGKYNYQETQAPNGYLLDPKSYTFELKYKDQNTDVIYENVERTDDEPTGNFTLVKKNADKSKKLQGTKYRIWNDNGYDKEFTTNSEGKIQIIGLKLGKYNYQEIQAPSGYLLDTKVYSFELKYKDQLTSIVYENVERTDDEPTGSIQIIKKSEQGDLLKGTIFKITANKDIKNVAETITYYIKGQEIARITTDDNGIAEITDIPLGDYVVEEVQATTGYLLDSTKHNVTLSYKGQNEEIILESLEKTNTTPKGEIKVYKTNDMNNRIKGAEISVYAKEDIINVAGTKTWYKKGDFIAKAVTNEQGMVTFSDLHLGHYYVKETNAPERILAKHK